MLGCTRTAVAMASNLLNHPDLGVGQHGWLAFELVGLLTAEPMITQRGLAERLGVSLGTVNGALRRLARNKVVAQTRRGAAAMKVYTLTKHGERFLAQTAESYFSARSADIERAATLLTALREHVGVEMRP